MSQTKELSFKIVNSSGAPVFESNDLTVLTTSGWDGQYNGTPQPSGIYFWEIKGTYEDGRAILLNGKESGIIHLVR